MHHSDVAQRHKSSASVCDAQSFFFAPFPDIGELDTPLQHAELLWPGLANGSPIGAKAVLCSSGSELHQEILWVGRRADRGSRHEQLEHIHKFMHELEGQDDCYLSINTFASPSNRRSDNVRSLIANVIDLDPPDGKNADHCVQHALDLISHARIPSPNLIVYTGRGAHLYWLYARVVPIWAQKRWSRVQADLIKLLRPAGADPSVSDTARIVRLVGTTNSKAPEFCRRVRAQILVKTRYSFDFFADQVLPIERAELEQIRKQPKLRRSSPRQAVKEAGSLSTGRRFSQTAEARLTDLKQLAVSCGSKIASGYRDKFMFAVAAHLAWVETPEDLPGAIEKWRVDFVASWPSKECMRAMGAVIRRAWLAKETQSKSFYEDPRYVISRAKLLELKSQIAPTSKLNSILDESELRERKTARRRERNGCKRSYSGAGISTQNIQLARDVQQLMSAGQSMRSIAAELSLSVGAVHKWSKLDLNAIEQLGQLTSRVFTKKPLNNGEACGPKGSKKEVVGNFDEKTAVDNQCRISRPVDNSRSDSDVLPSILFSQLPRPLDHVNDQMLLPSVEPKNGDIHVGNKKPFGAGQIDHARRIPIERVFNEIGLYCKKDLSYRPIQNGNAKARWYVEQESGVVLEVLVSDQRFYCPTLERGGGMAIDLVMMIFDCDFLSAVTKINEYFNI